VPSDGSVSDSSRSTPFRDGSSSVEIDVKPERDVREGTTGTTGTEESISRSVSAAAAADEEEEKPDSKQVKEEEEEPDSSGCVNDAQPADRERADRSRAPSAMPEPKEDPEALPPFLPHRSHLPQASASQASSPAINVVEPSVDTSSAQHETSGDLEMQDDDVAPEFGGGFDEEEDSLDDGENRLRYRTVSTLFRHDADDETDRRTESVELRMSVDGEEESLREDSVLAERGKDGRRAERGEEDERNDQREETPVVRSDSESEEEEEEEYDPSDELGGGRKRKKKVGARPKKKQKGQTQRAEKQVIRRKDGSSPIFVFSSPLTFS
jgi:hypothetical protein